MKGQVAELCTSLMSKPHEKHAFQLAYCLTGDEALVTSCAWVVGANGPIPPNGLGGANMPPLWPGTGPFALDHSGCESGLQKKDDAGVHRDYRRGPNHSLLDCHVLLGIGLAVHSQIHWPGGIAAAAYALGTAVVLGKQQGNGGYNVLVGQCLSWGWLGHGHCGNLVLQNQLVLHDLVECRGNALVDSGS